METGLEPPGFSHGEIQWHRCRHYADRRTPEPVAQPKAERPAVGVQHALEASGLVEAAHRTSRDAHCWHQGAPVLVEPQRLAGCGDAVGRARAPRAGLRLVAARSGQLDS
jgi:hypothetical protein